MVFIVEWIVLRVFSGTMHVDGFPISFMFSEYKLDRKRPKSANFQNLKVFIFHPVLMYFCKIMISRFVDGTLKREQLPFFLIFLIAVLP